jgi:hypothetical protein
VAVSPHGARNAGVADEHVQTARMLSQKRRRRGDGSVIGHVQLHEVRAEALLGGPDALRIPRSRQRCAELDEPASSFEAEALVGAGEAGVRHAIRAISG